MRLGTVRATDCEWQTANGDDDRGNGRRRWSRWASSRAPPRPRSDWSTAAGNQYPFSVDRQCAGGGGSAGGGLEDGGGGGDIKTHLTTRASLSCGRTILSSTLVCVRVCAFRGHSDKNPATRTHLYRSYYAVRLFSATHIHLNLASIVKIKPPPPPPRSPPARRDYSIVLYPWRRSFRARFSRRHHWFFNAHIT